VKTFCASRNAGKKRKYNTLSRWENLILFIKDKKLYRYIM
jgi:hypothetical protein